MALDPTENGAGTGARPPRTRAVPPAGRLALRELPLARTAAAAAAAAGAVLALLAVLASAAGRRAVMELERAEYSQLADEVRGRVERFARLHQRRLAGAVFDDALYAAMDSLAARPDTAWRPAFLDQFAGRDGDQFIGLYNPSGAEVFRWTSAAGSDLAGIVVPNAVLRVLDNREPAAGLVRKGDVLVWVAGAPILPARADRSDPIRGYVVTIRPFRPGDIAPGPGERPVRLELAAMTPPRQPVRPTVAAAPGDSVRVDFAINDLFAQQTTRAAAFGGRGGYAAAQGRLQLLLLISLLAIAALAAAAWWLVRRWMVAPVERLAQALAPVHSGATPAVIPPLSPAPEWARATTAINRLLTHARAVQERADRSLSAVRDGVWEQDLLTGEWTLGGRFRALLGYAEAELPATQAAVVEVIHPDDRAAVLTRLQACSGSAEPVSVEARLRRRDGAWAWFRLEATVQTDHAGQPMRFVGRLVSLEEQIAAREEALRADQARAEGRAAYARFLGALARGARGAPWASDLELVAEGLVAPPDPEDDPFDLHQLLQEIAAAAGGADVVLAPGVPPRVRGDRALVARALGRLAGLAPLASARRGLTLRAERCPGVGAAMLALSAEHAGAELAEEERARIEAILTGGLDRAGDGAADLDLLVAHQAGRALGATFDIESMSRMVRLRMTAALPEAVVEYEDTAELDFGAGADSGAWRDPADWAAPAVADDAAPVPAGPVEPRVEIVADATVTIDLDAASPAPEPVAAGFLAQLEPGPTANGLARQMAAMFVKDAPIRLRELAGAAALGDRPTTAALAQGLRGMAGLVGAAPLAAACGAVETATLDSDPEELVREVERVREALAAVLAALGARLPDAAASPARPVRPPIDAERIDQLRASLSADGGGFGSQLVSLFLVEAPALLAAVERAAASGDAAGIRAGVADLRNLCALVGAGPLGQLAAALDGAGPAEAAAAAAPLRAELGRAERALEALLRPPVNA